MHPVLNKNMLSAKEDMGVFQAADYVLSISVTVPADLPVGRLGSQME